MTALGLFASSWVAEETKTIKTLGSASKQKQKKCRRRRNIYISPVPLSNIRTPSSLSNIHAGHEGESRQIATKNAAVITQKEGCAGRILLFNIRCGSISERQPWKHGFGR